MLALLWTHVAMQNAFARPWTIDAQCEPLSAPPRHRGRGVLVTYTFGNMREFSRDLCDIFARSFAA
eukprot:3417428-Prymnesium_polylepis.1